MTLITDRKRHPLTSGVTWAFTVAASLTLGACGGGGGAGETPSNAGSAQPTGSTAAGSLSASAVANGPTATQAELATTSDDKLVQAMLATEPTATPGIAPDARIASSFASPSFESTNAVSLSVTRGTATDVKPNPATAVSGVIYYVDSTLGNDTNNGSSATAAGAGVGPWRSLAKLAAVGLKPGDSVRLACGGVWNETLKPNASGTSTSPISIGSHPLACSNPPVIDGSVALPSSAWTLHQGSIYRASVATTPLQLFVAGAAQDPAHHPNAGHDTSTPLSVYLRAAANGDQTIVGGRTGSTYLPTGSDLRLPVGAAITAGTKVRIRLNSWTLDERTISATTSGKLSLATPTSYPIVAGWGYFLLGQLWMLDSPGEWHADINNRYVYAWMPDSQTPGSRVSISQLGTGVDLATLQYVTIDNLYVRRIGTAFDLRGSTGVIVQKSRIEDTSLHGVYLPASIGTRLEANRIERTGLDAIAGVDNAIGIASELTAAENTIVDSGVLRGATGRSTSLPQQGLAAISAGYRATTRANRITGASYHGIRTTGSSSITNNVIDGVCLALDDCGGIYVYGASTVGTSVAGNIISNIVGNLLGKPAGTTLQSEGIYLDDHANGVTVMGNTVSGAETGILLHNAFNNTLSGNVLYGNRKHQIWLFEDSTTLKAGGDLYGNLITGNQMYPLAPTAALGQQSTIADTAHFATFDRNRYSALISSRVVSEAWPLGSNAFTFTAWQAATTAAGISRSPDANGSVVNAVGFSAFTVLASNIVTNGDISQGNKGWTPWNSTAPVATAVAQTCDGKPCLAVTAGGSSTLVATPPFSVVGDNWYRVSFDLRSTTGQSVSVLVRRGGGGTNGYESLMGSAEMVNAPAALRRFSFAFKASKTVNAADSVTRDIGARLYFDRIQPGTQLVLMNVEIVPVSAADASVKTQLFANGTTAAASYTCPDANTAPARCNQYLNFGTGSAVTWPLQLPALGSVVVYSRDNSLVDTDGDGISDMQDQCPATPAGAVTNARGCSL